MAEPSEAPYQWRRALAWLAFLGPFFFATYAFANWTASLRTAVPSIVFDWERHIPFLPWTILPYWIIDALYGISLFLCVSKRELDTHALRLLTAQVLAVACKTNGALRIAVDVAFVMICASVLTTFQHHFIDIPTGFALGWLCVWLWPDEESLRPLRLWQRASEPRRWRLAAYYFAGALACTLLAFALRGWALWLLWPALSLAFVASFYAGVGARGFQKDRDGRLSLAARWPLAPYLAGAWANSRAWTRTHPQPSHLADGVWIGRTPSARDLTLTPNAAIVDLAAELPLPRNARRRIVSASAGIGHCETAVAVGAAFARIRAAREQVVLDARHAAILAPLARVAPR